jgi:hypothetical protein
VSRLTWGDTGQHFYEAGVDRGVLYIDGSSGVPWNGLVSVEESPSGGDPDPYYIDGVKYLNLSAKEEFEATISAYYSPPEFDACDGMALIKPGLIAAQQRRKSFGLSYRTKLGNDLDDDFAYKIHLVYNALAQPTQRKYETASNSFDASLLSWSITTKPALLSGVGYTAHMIVDTSTAVPFSIETLEDILYGDDANLPRLPTLSELRGLFIDSAPLEVTDIGNDEYTITGSGFAVMLIDESTYQINGDTIVSLDSDTYQISSE